MKDIREMQGKLVVVLSWQATKKQPNSRTLSSGRCGGDRWTLADPTTSLEDGALAVALTVSADAPEAFRSCVNFI
jgi:hypothetical protein